MDVKELSKMVLLAVYAADEAANQEDYQSALGGYYAAHNLACTLIGGKTPIALKNRNLHRQEAMEIATKMGAEERTLVVHSFTI